MVQNKTLDRKEGRASALLARELHPDLVGKAGYMPFHIVMGADGRDLVAKSGSHDRCGVI